MPYVNIRVTDDGVTREQKARLIAEVTRALVEVLGKDPAGCHIVIDEVPIDNWGFAGESVRARRGASARWD